MSNSTDGYVYIIPVKNQFNIINVISLLTEKQFYINMPFFVLSIIIQNQSYYLFLYQISSYLQMSSVSKLLFRYTDQF